MPGIRHQQVSPSRPLTVEIPTGLDASMAANEAAFGKPSRHSRESATEADIKFGERTAFIPMTCQERQVLDRLEAGLQSAASLWRDSQQQQEHDRLLSSALHHWRAPSAGIDTSWVWEVGRWSTQFSLPFALELRRLDPTAVADSDQLLALSTCLRNRQIDLAKKLTAAAAVTAASPAADSVGPGAGGSGKKKKSAASTAAAAAAAAAGSLDDLEEEPCLCQIRWGLAPDTEAAKRRQLEKLDDQQKSPTPLPQPQPHQQSKKLHHQKPVAAAAAAVAGCSQARRPIVKTSHLRGNFEAALTTAEDAGYASQNCSPPGNRGGGFINDLLAASTYGGRAWAD